jgi:hypothetical protein
LRTFTQKPKETQQTTSAKATTPDREGLEQNHEVNSILHLQRTAGNQAVLRMLETNTEERKRSSTATETPHFGSNSSRIPIPAGSPMAGQRIDKAMSSVTTDTGGLTPGVGPDRENEDIGGRTFGEVVGDVFRPVGSALGNVVGSVAEAVTGIGISSNTTTPAAWNNHGHFLWEVGFNTTGRNGWIVQEVESTRRAQDAAGQTLPDGLTRDYWEAWAVDAAGNVAPSAGATNDTWQRRSWGNNTQGHWSIKGSVYFSSTDPATQGFAVGNVAEAGSLLSTTSAPSGLGVARLHRYAQGTWDSTGAVPTHTGSAS